MDLSTLPKSKKLEMLALLEEKERRRQLTAKTVVGFVCPEKGFTHAIVRDGDKWERTSQKPDLYMPAKMERAVTSTKRFIVVIGGRGSAKSVSVGDICLIDARDNEAKTYCLREYQSSIRNSVHSLLKEEIGRLGFNGFDPVQNAIYYKDDDAFEFAGLSRNVDSIKSAHGFKRYWVEEAQSISEDSLRALIPTARQKPNKGLPGEKPEEEQDDGVSMMFVANPGSTEDPFSKRFIIPFLSALERDGFYEDHLHLILVMNYMDNPWFMESGLEEERQWAYQNMPRALYDHIWLGKFNDSVDNGLIQAEWFDACIDAHKTLGFESIGAKIASHDPSDMGEDSKGYALRHGSVVLDVQEKTDGNVNEGGHWAAGVAQAQGADYFSWDGDGMGAGLAEQMGRDFKDKGVTLSMFRGSEGPDNPDAQYMAAVESPVQHKKTNKETFKNKRAQYYFALRDRIYRTYLAVVRGEYHDPDRMISFSSSIPLLSKLRAELCRIPIKPNANGLNELYTKEEMKRRFKIASPNLGDSVMMGMRYVSPHKPQVQMPKPIKTIGRR